MPVTMNFRTAFNGFHREDVVRYIDAMNTQHKQAENALQDQIHQLEQELEESKNCADCSAELEACRTAMEKQEKEAQERFATYEKMILELEEQLSQLKATGVKRDLEQEELEIYRRAERTERLAKERVNQMYDSANALLAQVQEQLSQRGHAIEETAAEVAQKLTEVQFAFREGAETAQKAAAALQEMHLEMED